MAMENSDDKLMKRIARLVGCDSSSVKPSNFNSRLHEHLLIQQDDKPTLAVRVLLKRDQWSADCRGYDIMKHLSSHNPQLPIPHVHALDEGGPDEHPLALTDWAPGSWVHHWHRPIPKLMRYHFLHDLSEFLLMLWSVPLADDAPQEPYSVWLRREVDCVLRRILHGTADWGRAVDLLVMRSLIPQYARDFDDIRERGIAHGDMRGENFVIDGAMTLKGVVNWDRTYSAPLPAVVHFPWFMAEIPGWRTDGDGEDETLAWDRRNLTSFIGKKASQVPSAAHMARLLDSAWERQFFQAALQHREVHDEFVRMHCPRDAANVAAAISEFASFLNANGPGLGDSMEARQVQASLEEMQGELRSRQ